MNYVKIKRGSSVRLVCSYRDSDGQPIDLTGWSVSSTMVARTGGLPFEFEFSVDMDHGDVHQFALTATPQQSADFHAVKNEQPNMIADISITQPDGFVRMTDSFLVLVKEDQAA